MRKIMSFGVILLFLISLNAIYATDSDSNDSDDSQSSVTDWNQTEWTVNNSMNNSEIQNIIYNCKENSTITFSSGMYNQLSLMVFKSLNFAGNGTVILKGNGSDTALTFASNCHVEGFTIQNYSTGIFNMADNITIVNNTFRENVGGLVNYGTGSGVKVISNNVFQSNTGSAIYNYGKNTVFKGFKLVNNAIGIVNSGLNVDITCNAISGGKYGIINYAQFADINYNKIYGTSQSSIYNTGSGSKIKNNTLQKNNYGIDNQGSNSTISYNRIIGGISILNSANSTTISGNTITSAKSYGIYNTGQKNKIYYNSLTGLSQGFGIYSEKKANYNLVQSNTVSKFSYGVLVAGYANIVKYNKLKYNKIGLYLANTAKNTQVISNKMYKSTTCGIYNYGVKSTLYKNELIYNLYGLVTVQSVNNLKNIMKGNKINVIYIKG